MCAVSIIKTGCTVIVSRMASRIVEILAVSINETDFAVMSLSITIRKRRVCAVDVFLTRLTCAYIRPDECTSFFTSPVCTS